MKKLFKLLLLGLTIVIISGCTHKSTVKPSEKVSITAVEKLPYVVAIDAQALKGKKLIQNWDMADLTVVYGDSLIVSIKNEMANRFKKVFILDESTRNNYYDYKIVYNNEIKGNCSRKTCNYNSSTNMTVFDKNKTIVYKEVLKDKFDHETPDTAIILAYITGFTLFVSSPVTLPAQAAIRGNVLNEDVYNSQNRVVSQIGFKLSDSKVFTGKNSILKVPSYKN